MRKSEVLEAVSLLAREIRDWNYPRNKTVPLYVIANLRKQLLNMGNICYREAWNNVCGKGASSFKEDDLL